LVGRLPQKLDVAIEDAARIYAGLEAETLRQETQASPTRGTAAVAVTTATTGACKHNERC
jgi:hypothetical protein